MFSCIYLWTNEINGKHYVGQTQCFYNRMMDYKNGKATPYLNNAMKKYGIENFSIEIIEKCCIEALDEREQYWMDYYESYIPSKVIIFVSMLLQQGDIDIPKKPKKK